MSTTRRLLRVPSDVLEGLCHGTKEHAIEDAGILEAQGAEGVWQRKHHMDVGDIEHLTFPRGEPGHLGGPVTLGAVAVATGIIADLLVATVVTLGFVAPQGGGAADGDGAQGPMLLLTQASAIAYQKGAPYCWTTSATSSGGRVIRAGPEARRVIQRARRRMQGMRRDMEGATGAPQAAMAEQRVGSAGDRRLLPVRA